LKFFLWSVENVHYQLRILHNTELWDLYGLLVIVKVVKCGRYDEQGCS